MPQAVSFHLNDQTIADVHASPTTTLLEYLRGHLRLTGTKEGCAEGDCGACSVAFLDPDGPAGPTYRAVNACLVLLPMVHGRRVYTVEGLREKTGEYHPVQEALVRELGSQCGYCTPGVVMAMFEACYRRDLTSRGSSTTRCAATCAAAPATGRSATRPARSPGPAPTTGLIGSWWHRRST
jgi:xanthine dehydrogenase small subunit